MNAGLTDCSSSVSLTVVTENVAVEEGVIQGSATVTSNETGASSGTPPIAAFRTSRLASAGGSPDVSPSDCPLDEAIHPLKTAMPPVTVVRNDLRRINNHYRPRKEYFVVDL